MAKKSRLDLLEQNNDVIYTNTNREVTEQKLHDHVEDIIDSSSNLKDDDILVLKEFIIKVNKEEAYIENEINKLFYDYGEAAINQENSPPYNTKNYAFAIFKITENGFVIHDDVLPLETGGTNPLKDWLVNNATIESGVTMFPISVKAYMKMNLPAISKIFGYNESFFNIRGGELHSYKNTKLKTLEYIGNTNFPNFFSSLLDRFVAKTRLTRPLSFDKSALWFSGVQSSFYTAHRVKAVTFLRFGTYNNTESFGRKVWNSVTEVWENIGVNPSANGFNQNHYLDTSCSFVYVLNKDDNFSYVGSDIKDKYWGKETRSLIRVYLWRVVKNGNEDCYYFTIKPLGLDCFELSRFDTEQYQLLALLDDGYSTPIIRFVDAEEVTEPPINRSYRVRKVNLLKSNMMLNAKTRRRSEDKRAFKSCRFFYMDIQGNASKLGAKISVVTNKRGYKRGLMIDNL